MDERSQIGEHYWTSMIFKGRQFSPVRHQGRLSRCFFGLLRNLSIELKYTSHTTGSLAELNKQILATAIAAGLAVKEEPRQI